MKQKKRPLCLLLSVLLCLAMTLPASAGGYMGEIKQNGTTHNIATEGSGDGWSFIEYKNGSYISTPELTLNNCTAESLSLSEEALDGDITIILANGSVNKIDSLSFPLAYESKTVLTVTGDGTLIIGELTVIDYDGYSDDIENPLDFFFVADGATVTVTGNAHTKGDGLPFTDVPEDAYYWDAVEWAIEESITKGTSETAFSPDAPCTRGQVATFLWRAADCPEPVTTENPFTDVDPSSAFYKAILWAYEEEITAGTSATTFSPGNTCTYAHVITFLWRFLLEPDASSPSAFAESLPQGYYTPAVAWADSEEILSDAGEFQLSAPCPRADIVTYLYRVFM